ncbi:hypothetical protein [Crocosphaera sp. Alani8]|uniref:hypothetical protein n=1 Tax=Crocosphaera sp. Alani8 TaxID=3038952 RepID=UPI00313D6D9E
MSYTEIQRIECQGIPSIEYQTEPDDIPIPERIQFDFIPQFPYDQYGYNPPKFVYCEQVILVEEWLFCQEQQYNFFDEHEVYRICALEIEEYSLTGKTLYEAPSWKYGIRGTRGTRELIWFEEDELISLTEINSEDQEF